MASKNQVFFKKPQKVQILSFSVFIYVKFCTDRI